MAVAVRLIEALTLITMLGVLMASTIIVVIADRIFGLIMFILWPTCWIISICTAFAESLMVTVINCLVNVANSFGSSYLYYA